MNRYIKVKGHSNWFLVLESSEQEPENLSEVMSEKILRSLVTLHNKETFGTNEIDRIRIAATREIDYEAMADKYGTILIRPIGSWMTLKGNEIIEEKYDNHFPIEEYGEIVICENDKNPEPKWIAFLKGQFPDKKIVTINYFDLRTEKEVAYYFEKAELITFSTTFSNFEWFEKLTKLAGNQDIIGYCHDPEKWKQALKINKNVQIIKTI